MLVRGHHFEFCYSEFVSLNLSCYDVPIIQAFYEANTFRTLL